MLDVFGNSPINAQKEKFVYASSSIRFENVWNKNSCNFLKKSLLEGFWGCSFRIWQWFCIKILIIILFFGFYWKNADFFRFFFKAHYFVVSESSEFFMTFLLFRIDQFLKNTRILWLIPYLFRSIKFFHEVVPFRLKKSQILLHCCTKMDILYKPK